MKLPSAVKAIARRDLSSWFGSVTGYVFILLFVVVAAFTLVRSDDFFRANLATLDTLNAWYHWLAIFFTALVTMGMWASERSHGTQELLFTLPASDGQILLGKFLAGAGIYTVALLFMLTLPIGLEWLGDPDWGLMFSNFVGFWLFGMMLIAVSMLGSQLTSSLTVAFLFGAIANFVVVFLPDALMQTLPAIASMKVMQFLPDWLLKALPTLGTEAALNGPTGQFAQFARGVIPLSGVLLFVGLTVAFLYLNLALLSRRHWRQGEDTAVHAGVRFVAMAVGCLGATVFAVNKLTPIDGTAERIHSLSAESVKLIEGLDPKRPVYVTAFVSESVPPMLEQQKRTLLNLLDRYDSIGGAAVEKRVVITQPLSPEATDAQKNYGIQPRIPPVDDGTDYSDGVFLGFAVQCGIEAVTVPFVDPGLSVEYELTRSIRVAANAERKTVGVLKTDVELYGGIDFQTFQQKPRWQIVDELLLQYKVENVDPDKDYNDDIDALVVPQPSSLNPEQMDRLQRWIAAGHPTLLLEDPEPQSAPGTSATDPKGGQRNPFGGGPQPGQKGDLQRFLADFDLSFPQNDVVWDMSFKTFRLLQIPIPEYLFVGEDGISQDDVATKGLKRLVFLMSGHLRSLDKPGFKMTPLVRSYVRGTNDMNGIIPKLSIFQFGFPGMPKQLDFNRRHSQRPGEYVLAAHVTGKAPGGSDGAGADDKGKDPQKPVNLIVVADLDAFSNSFFQLRSMNDNDNLRFDNVTFILNCIDSLAGDDTLIELRKRRPVLRPLTTVMAAQEQFERKWIDQRESAEDAAAAELDKAQKRLDEAVAKIRDNPEIDERAKDIRIQAEQDKENRNLEVRKEQIEVEKRKKIGEAKHEKNVRQKAVQVRYQVMTIGLAFLPPLLLAAFTFFRRMSRESQNVPKNRMVRRGGK